MNGKSVPTFIRQLASRTTFILALAALLLAGFSFAESGSAAPLAWDYTTLTVQNRIGIGTETPDANTVIEARRSDTTDTMIKSRHLTKGAYFQTQSGINWAGYNMLNAAGATATYFGYRGNTGFRIYDALAAEDRLLMSAAGTDNGNIWLNPFNSGGVGIGTQILNARLQVVTASGSAIRGDCDATTEGNAGVIGTTSSPGGYGVEGYAAGTSGTRYGVYGETNYAEGGLGVLDNGSNYGVYGKTDVTPGYGVYGWASATDGSNYGVYGRSDSPDGHGVYGYASAVTGVNYGVYGQNDSASGYGLFGYASSTIGSATGVTGQTNSSSGTGVSGRSLATSGTAAGVYGLSNSTSGYGLYGYASATTGTNSGVYGQSDSASGYGLFGYASAGDGLFGYASATTGENYGVGGQSDSTSGYGVYGYASATTGANYGVSGQSASTSGRGVYGVAAAGSGSTYGVYGRSNSTEGTGVYGVAEAGTGVNYGVYGLSMSTSGYGVYYAGGLAGTGTKSAIVETQDHGWRHLYAVESPQNWFEDFGQATLSAGEAEVPIEEVFAQTVNLGEGYHIFLTPLGDGCTLFVADKSSTSFTVRAQNGAECEIAFDYRIIAPRLDYEDLRLEPAQDPETIAAAAMAAMPEIE